MKFTTNHRKSYQGWRRFGSEDGHQAMFTRYHRGESRGFGERGEGKRRFFERGEFKFALLELLASAPMHGYQLIKAMEEKTGGLYIPSAGSVYPNLQLLEDMSLIGSSEQDGKKLYHITEKGSEYLLTNRKVEWGRAEKTWDRCGREQMSERSGRRELRELMKEWSEAVYLMARAAKSAQDHPDSAQAEQFKQVMAEFQERLKELAVADTSSSADTGETPAPQPDSSAKPDDSGQI